VEDATLSDSTLNQIGAHFFNQSAQIASPNPVLQTCGPSIRPLEKWFEYCGLLIFWYADACIANFKVDLTVSAWSNQALAQNILIPGS